MTSGNANQVVQIGRNLLILLVFFAFSPLFGASQPEKPPEKPDENISLGDFYLECSRAFRIELPEGWGRSKAWMLLRATGLQVDGEQDMSQPLRHRHVLEIGHQLGIRFSSQNPEELFTRSQVEAFLTRFHEYFRLPIRKSLRPLESQPPEGNPDSPQESEKPGKN